MTTHWDVAPLMAAFLPSVPRVASGWDAHVGEIGCAFRAGYRDGSFPLLAIKCGWSYRYSCDRWLAPS